MTRAAIYARFSSELQSDRSIDDQVVLCREYAARHGWTVTEAYADYAVSGSSVHGRFAFERLVADARAGRFDIILAEDLDRLSRNQADIAGLYERMQFAGVKLWTVGDGEISEMHIGLKGTMSALFLKALVLKIHRGMAGRVRAGKNPGGIAYGYRAVRMIDDRGEPVRGERSIDEQEAAVVRRIFADTLSGKTPREIAAALNSDGVPSPRGGHWNASTIHGSRKRGTGILRQELYAGRMVWNRQRFVKNPDTGRRVTRTNTAAQHQAADVPQLRIVDDGDWLKVQALLVARGGPHASHARKSPHIFSGLMRCGVCCGKYVSAGGSKYPRFICSRRKESGTCTNTRIVSARIIEDRTLAALERDLLDERLVAEVVREYTIERQRLKSSRRQHERRAANRLGEIDRAVRGLVALVEAGADPASVMPRLRELEGERAAIKAERPHPGREVIELHPGIGDRYRAIVRDLRASLGTRTADRKIDVIASVRSLVDRIVVYPHDDPAGRDLELVGQLAGLLGTAEQVVSGMMAVVAGEGFGRPHTSGRFQPVIIPFRSVAA